MAQYGKEGRALIQRLLDELDLDAEVSKNAKKQLRRALGSLIFSSDSVGYLDIVENAFAKGKTARQALMSVRSASEKLIESYAPVKGIFEAHHTQALSALREAYLTLPPSEQDNFLQMIEDRGWKLGDDPEQLVETVFSRMSHQGKVPEVKKGDPTGMKGLFADSQVPAKELQGHPRGTRDALLQTKPGQFSTGADLFSHFETVIAPRAAEDAANALVQDAPARVAAAKEGLDLVEVTPEANIARVSTPEGVEATRKGVEAFAGEYTPTDKGAREILQQVGEEPAEFLTRPTAIADMGEIIYPTVTGFTKDQIKKLARRSLVAAGAAIPIVGIGAQAAEVQAAEQSGDTQRQAEETAQLGVEAASTVFPAADLINIGTDVAQTYRDIRATGATNKDILDAGVQLAGEAIQNPGKVVNVVGESLKEIPGQVMSGFQYLGQKLQETRSKVSLSGYSPF